MMMRFRSGELVVTLFASIVLAGFAAFEVWPVARVLEASLSGPTGPAVAGYVALLYTPAGVDVVLVSFGVAAAVTGLVMIMASPLAYGLARGARGGCVVRRLLLVPLVTPPFTAGLGVVLLLGRQGILTRALGLGWSIEGVQGIVAGQVITFLPHAALALGAVFGRVHADLEEAAEILGAGPLIVLRRVTLSLTRRGIVAIALVVFLLSLSDLGTPMIAGGDARVMTTAIYASVVASHDVVGASTVATLLLVLSLISYGVALALAGWTVHVATAPAPRDEAVRSRRATRLPLLAVTLVVPAIFVVVDGAVGVGSVVRAWGTDWSWSGHHFATMPTAALANSLAIGLVAALVATLTAIVATSVARHFAAPGRRVIEAVGTLPVGVPGPVLGAGYLLIAGDASPAAAVTPVLIVASIVAGKLPLAGLRVIRRLNAIEPATEEVAVSLGAGRIQIFARIVALPLSRTVVGGFVDVFTAAILTVGAVAFLTGSRVPLASVDALDRARAGSLGTACAVAVTLSLIAGAVEVVRRRVGGDEPLILCTG